MLLRKLLLVALLLSLAAGALALWGVDRVRARDRALAVEWMAASFQTDLIRARCETNPKWFLAGPRENAPSAQLLADPEADVLAPRPDANPRPVEFFAYDIELVGQSTAAPRLSNWIRSQLRGGATSVTENFSTGVGTGTQTAVATRWEGPCAFLLVRMHPASGQMWQRAGLFGVFSLLAFVVTMMVVWPVERRIRRVGAQMRTSARTEYRDPAAVSGRDELSQLGFAFNEAAVDINRLHTDFRDRDADSRRFLSYITADSESLLQAALTSSDSSRIVTEAVRLSNVVVGAQLRDAAPRTSSPVDVAGVMATVVKEFEPLAASRRVAIDSQRLDAGVVVQGDPLLLAQAFRNLIALALDREPAGGRVVVEVRKGDGEGFSVSVADTGPNLADADVRKLNAVRRFRGDEGRGADLRGDIGLGPAVVHEVCHRFQLDLSFERPVTGGLEARISRTISPRG
jgi:signal transduction histidine kinase